MVPATKVTAIAYLFQCEKDDRRTIRTNKWTLIYFAMWHWNDTASEMYFTFKMARYIRMAECMEEPYCEVFSS